ncbi:MAG: exodeoxyribonuclease VII large subunit [Planctomycetota bacterium]
MPETISSADSALSISQLTARLKTVVESSFPNVWVVGEVSNFSRPQSGHCYLTLKDDDAQLRAVVWRSTAAKLTFDLRDGLEVVCQGRLDLYPPRGSYQLVVQKMEPRGVGALELALKKLQAKLAAEGLFDGDRKRTLPRFPRRIGVVTSPTGAAIRDFLEVLRRRWRGVEVLVYPTRVQGEGSAEEVAQAIRIANQTTPKPDVLVVTRGGGSIEDLWAFNEEATVRAVASSRIPTVSAIGHEIDVTLSDLAADLRALTPSEAAERVVPSSEEFTAGVESLGNRLRDAIRTRTAILSDRLDAIATRPVFARPMDPIHLLARSIDESSTRLHSAANARLTTEAARVASIAGRIEALSPLAVLSRGYSLTQRADGGPPVTDASVLHEGDRLRTRLASGEVVSIVASQQP